MCSAHNKRCLGLNVLEKGKNISGAKASYPAMDTAHRVSSCRTSSGPIAVQVVPGVGDNGFLTGAGSAQTGLHGTRMWL